MEMYLVFKEWDNTSVALFFDRMEAVKYALRFDGYGVQSCDVNGDICSIPLDEDFSFLQEGFYEQK